MHPSASRPTSAHHLRRAHSSGPSLRLPFIIVLLFLVALLLRPSSDARSAASPPRSRRRARRCIASVFACSSPLYPPVTDLEHFQQICSVAWAPSAPPPAVRSRFAALVTAEGWNFARAYNMAAFQSACDVLFIQPCNATHVPDELVQHADRARRQHTFFVAWPRTLPMIVSRSAFLAVSGFDERVDTQRAAVSYMAEHLDAMGFAERFLQNMRPTVEHDIAQRQQQLLIPFAEPWGAQSALLRDGKPPSLLHHSLGASVVQQASQHALASVLHDTYNVPWLLLVGMTPHQLSSLHHRLQKDYKSVMVAHVAHGLGNRLRAFAGAKSFADATSRVLILVWERDVHCEASFDDLFERDGLLVVNELDVKWPFEEERLSDGAWTQWTMYNYMSAEGGVKDERLKHGRGPVYYRGAYVPKAEDESLVKHINGVLRALRPVSQVADKVDEISERLNTSIGVHIRHSDPQTELQGFAATQLYGDSETQVMQYWRSVSAAPSFAKEIQRIWEGAGTSGTEVFVASDCVKCRDELADVLGESVWWMEGDGCQGGDRSTECMVQATADLWALARCERVLGSMWSSFSEIAGRLRGGVRYAGADFGRVGTEEWGPAVRLVAERVWNKRDGSRR